MDDYESHMKELKEDLFSLIRPEDSVVELGAGLGPNIKMLPPTITCTVSVVACMPAPTACRVIAITLFTSHLVNHHALTLVNPKPSPLN